MPGRRLSFEEREQIGWMTDRGCGVREIARAACRGRRPGGARARGRRPDHRQGRQERGDHPGRAVLPVLPDQRPARGPHPDKAADALADRILALPQALRRSLTWDRGIEMKAHAAFTIATGVQVCFADPYSPWLHDAGEESQWAAT